MEKITELGSYHDDQGNTITGNSVIEGKVSIIFKGRNNRLILAQGAKVADLEARFDCDNGTLIIGANPKVGGIRMNIRVGQDSVVKVGDNVSTTSKCIISAVEGSKVTFGNDVMIASGNQFRADDAHPIFDVQSGQRVNPATDIVVGNHVWIAAGAALLGGAEIGDGSVVGFRSLVTRKIPNNCIAVGTPAKVVRRNIAWERPHLSNTKPYYKPDASSVKKTEDYWNLTEVEESEAPVVVPLTRAQIVRQRVAGTLRSLADRLD